MADTTTPVPAWTLLDDDAEARFRELGYVVVDWLDDERVDVLHRLAREVHPSAPDEAPWACDFYSDDAEVKARIRDAIGTAFAEPLRRCFTGHETFLHAFVANWPGEGGGLQLHQHSSVVDEPHQRSAVAWCALTDITPTTGTLYVVPRSHRVLPGPKAERSPDWFEDRAEQIMAEHGVPVTLRRGQALLFDNALLHYSDANRGTEPRLTAVSTLAPTAGGLRYFSWTDRDEIEVYRLEPEFFLDAVSSDLEWARPEGLSLLEVRPAQRWSPSDEELARLLAPDGPGGRPRRRRWRRGG